MKDVTIVCDGSSLGNATNQQAEIAAAAIGLENLKQPCRVHLMSDSRYVIETMNGRFRKKTNHDWWRRLEKASDSHEITWEWTKGHAGHEIQEIADSTARTIAGAGHVDQAMLDEAVLDIGVKEL